MALETEFTIHASAEYADLDKSRLLRNFMKFVSRISAHVTWLIFDAQFPQSDCQNFQGFYHLCRYSEEDLERYGAILGVNSQITPRFFGGVGQ